MNKYFTRVILLISTIIISAKAYAYDFMVDSMYFNIESIDEMTCAITYGDKEYTGELVIPEKVTYKGRTLTVTTIESEAFSGCSGLTSINIPNSVTTIGLNICNSCRELIIGNGIKNFPIP